MRKAAANTVTDSIPSEENYSSSPFVQMSLHIGNLPPRIRIDDLERVFRRFGRCSLQVKDKYGFVVYDYPASAEKALKMLRGKRICGEAITLSWSNRQPRPLQRFARGGKSYEPTRRKNAVKENIHLRLTTNDRRDYEMQFRQVDEEGRNFGLGDLVGESTSHNPDDLKGYLGERDHTSLSDTNRIASAGKNHLEDDRWGEPVINPSNGMENGIEFDRYEPYHSDDKKESNEHQNMSIFSGSPTSRKGEERSGTGFNGHLKTSDYTSKGKSQRTCYACGEVGHKLCNCPRELKRHSSRSRGRQLPVGENPSRRYHESDREPSTSRSHQRSLNHEDSSPRQKTPDGERREFRDKKRDRLDYEDVDNIQPKKAKGTSSSSNDSDYSLSGSRSPSKSPTSLPHSSSSPSMRKLKFKSKLLHMKNLSKSSPSPSSPSFHSPFESQSISNIFSPLPVNKHLSPSVDERRKTDDDSVVNAVGLANSEGLSETVKPFRKRAVSASEDIAAAEANECEARTADVEKEERKEDLCKKDDEHCHSISRVSDKELETTIPQSNGDSQHSDMMFPQALIETRDSEYEDAVKQPTLALESDVSFRPNAVRMSPEEIYMVLKHYGLQCPEENEKNLPAEVYFGSARSWPWEIIYYRRLKKGPISTVNYARRIAQNEEFGIVDRYIRGSSGWTELDEDNS